MNPLGSDTARPLSPPSRRADGFTPLDVERIARLNRLYDGITRFLEEDREQRRYGAAAENPEACLCTPVDYGTAELSHIPARILEIDYGCGDPTRYAQRGETVLDLGSGSGKHCFMMARQVGPEGQVIGIDKTPRMLELARGAVGEVTAALNYPRPNVEFRRGCIENLRWNLDLLDPLLRRFPPDNYDNLARIETALAESPLVASDSVDLIVSNCVLNLVDDRRKAELFPELFRVLKRGGRAVVSDIVAAEDVPAEMKNDEALWTGCLAGALRRDRFLEAFVAAGFYGVEEVSAFFWRTEEGISFYSVTVAAYKGKEGACWETYRNALYRGPFRAVEDDDGHRFPRGVPVPVCEKTARILARGPYADHFLVSEALAQESERIPFDCGATGRRQGVPAPIHEALTRSAGPVEEGGCDPKSGCC